MDEVDANSTRPKSRWATLAVAAISGAGAIALAAPAAIAGADPVPPPAPTTAAPPPPNGPADAPPGPAGLPASPPPTDPVGAPPAVGPNAPPPPATDPNAPQPARIDNPVGGFSYVIPAGWVESDATHLDYGSALLSKQTGPPPTPGQPPPVANDTRVVLGKLDQKLYASAEPDNTKAATRLASDMGEFFMPYPGTRINQETTPLTANGVSGGASYYEVKFSDASKPNGQIWAAVISPAGPNAPQGSANQRWFVVWLGTSNDPVDKAGATTLAESVRPLAPPPPAAPPAPGAPAPAPAPGAPAPGPAPAAPAPAPAPGAPAPAPAAPGPAPAPGAPPPPAPPPPPGQPAGGNGPAPAPGAVST
jgi:Fibronectin-attachment protein (FAP)